MDGGRRATGARINDLHAYLCAFRSKPPVSANRVTHKHAHPLATESGYPKSALKISSRPSRAEPSRAARSRHVGYIFFSTPVHRSPSRFTYPSAPYIPLLGGAHPPLAVYSRSFFPSRARGGGESRRDGYRESGIKRMMVTKREKSTVPPPRW